jgi:DNA-binding transcriptional LysR family regulator
VSLVQQATNRFVDLIGEGFDLGLRGHGAPLADSDLVQRPIARFTWHLFAAPAYLAASGTPARAPELARYACLMVPNRGGETVWTLRHPSEGEQRVVATPRIVSDDPETLQEGAIAGLGMHRRAPSLLLPRGDGVRTLAARPARLDRRRHTGDAVTPTRRGQLPAVRALVEFLVAEYPALVAAELPSPVPPAPPRRRAPAPRR